MLDIQTLMFLQLNVIVEIYFEANKKYYFFTY